MIPQALASLAASLAVASASVFLGAEQSIDADRLMHDMSVLAHDSMEGRRSGSLGAARARAFLIASLGEAGLDPLGPNYELPFTMGNVRGVNLAGSVPGRVLEQTIVLTAHYDHEGSRDGVVFNGADDNASGVAAALAIARAVAAEPLRHRLVVVFTDAEEIGLVGARAFVRDQSLEGIQLNVNLDMVSRTGGELWAAGAHHTPELRPVLERVSYAASLELRLGHDRPGAPEGADWTNASDHAPFHQAGISFVYFGVEDHPDYHRPTDDVDRVDPDEFLAAAQTILAALRALDEALPPTPEQTR